MPVNLSRHLTRADAIPYAPVTPNGPKDGTDKHSPRRVRHVR
ncbi:hypothetical protein Poly24_15210 [Rosistilla carotiformis]|uniref:Uncharacterized protein n=1 Tax=Rosistilla carotiformis TaxID=2528017 RepID=A0A518JQJ5_9BACT|nr:hypothetical protein Poly24_15210 [Rosistilla carotiformis]